MLLLSASVQARPSYQCVQSFPYEELKSHEQQCSHLVDFNYRLGVLALKQKQYSHAITALERVTLQAPEHAGAWMDLAQVYYQSGDFYKLQQAVELIESRFNPPPGIRLALNRYRSAYQNQNIHSDWEVRGQAEFELGHASNVNNGSKHQYIDLAGLELELSENNLPQADWFSSASLQVSTTGHHNGWGLSGWGAGKTLNYHSLSEHNSQWFLIGGTAQKKLLKHNSLQISGYHLQLKTRNNSDQDSLWLQARYQNAFTLQDQLSFWAIYNQLDAREQGDSDVYKLGAQWQRQYQGSTYSLSLELAEDIAEKGELSRSGGDRKVIVLRAKSFYPMETGAIGVNVNYRYERDEESYNAALFGAEKRNLKQYRIEASYYYPLAKQQRLELWSEFLVEESEIALFESNGWQGGVCWQYYW